MVSLGRAREDGNRARVEPEPRLPAFWANVLSGIPSDSLAFRVSTGQGTLDPWMLLVQALTCSSPPPCTLP